MNERTQTAAVAAHAPNRAIRVFVAEDHQITLQGLRQLIEASSPRMSLVGTARTRAELLAHEGVAQADVILLDLDLDGENAVVDLAELRQRCPGQVLILTGAVDHVLHRAAMVKGARGVVHKTESAETILRAIEKVHQGEIWLNRALLGEVMDQLAAGNARVAPPDNDPDAERIASLTPREREIIRVMIKNPGDKQFAIADELSMSEHTLRNHLTTIYSKLDVHGRLELHLYATARGLGAVGANKVSG